MDTEYEAKILEVDVEEIKKRLEELGAVFVGEKFQKRYVYHFVSKQENKWVRLRTDGEITTLAVKEVSENTISGTQEAEIVVNDFAQAHKLILALGFRQIAYQENKRVSYELEGVDVEIDTWPRIPTYIEVEGPSEEEVVRVVEKLGFREEQIVSKPVKEIYSDYGIDLHEIDELRF
ncbi:MAG: class IV adenylate cyclase [Candidatus Woesearchaeota archaeon]